MPKTRRPVSEYPQKARFSFCRACLFTAVEQFDPTGGVAFEIYCCFDGVASILCEQCFTRNSVCEPLPGGILGDAFDLVLLLEFLDGFWAEQNDAYVFDAAIRDIAASAGFELAKAFVSVVKAHRADHALTATKKTTVQKARPRYEAFLVGRRALLTPLPKPDRNSTAAEYDAYFSSTFCRFMPGDVGFGPWAAAKRACYDAIEAGYHAVFGGVDTVEGAMQIEMLDEEFPDVLYGI